MDELLVRHRKEQRDLQSRITQKKKSATKKTRRGVNEECERLERELKDRQEAEILRLSKSADAGSPGDENDILEESALQELNGNYGNEREPSNTANESPHEPDVVANGTKSPPFSVAPHEPPLRKANRQKARMARRAAEREAVVAQAAAESLSLPDLKKREKEAMDAEFKRRGLQEKEVRADGHCLYAAVADGLQYQKLGLRPRIPIRMLEEEPAEQLEDYKVVRKTAAAYMKTNSDDFAPFLEEPLDEYVHKVGDTAEWGGQLELLALARAYGVDIAVLQGDGRVVEIEGGGADTKRLWLAYYKYNFGLGEHYNSLRKTDG